MQKFFTLLHVYVNNSWLNIILMLYLQSYEKINQIITNYLHKEADYVTK